MLADVAAGDPVGDSVKAHAGQAFKNLKRKAASEMQGSGAIKRRKTTSRSHSTRKPRPSKKAVSFRASWVKGRGQKFKVLGAH